MQTAGYLLAVKNEVVEPGALFCEKTELGDKCDIFQSYCFSHPEYVLILYALSFRGVGTVMAQEAAWKRILVGKWELLLGKAKAGCPACRSFRLSRCVATTVFREMESTSSLGTCAARKKRYLKAVFAAMCGCTAFPQYFKGSW